MVRYLANGLTVRSTVERGGEKGGGGEDDKPFKQRLRCNNFTKLVVSLIAEVENNILNTRGDLIQCFFLQGSIFFGNGKR